jgi:hypothetical protein
MRFAFPTVLPDPWRPATVAALVLLCLLPLVLRSDPGSAAPLCEGATATVCIVPASQSVTQGTQFDIDVAADAVENVGAFQFTLNYDPNLIRFASASSGSFIRSTGRESNCSSPAPGSDDDGVATFWCTTIGGTPPPGASGSGFLYHVQFNALGPGTTDMAFSNVKLTTPNAVPIPVATEDGAVTVTPATPTHTPTPCVGECPTATATASPTATPTLALQGAHVAVEPVPTTIAAGTTATIHITISDVPNLGAYQFQLEWDPNLLVFVDVQNADFLGSTRRSVFCPQPQVATNSVRFGCATFGNLEGPSGDGVLAIIELRSLSFGTSPLALNPEELIITQPLATGVHVSTITDAEIVIDSVPDHTATPCPDGICPTSTPTNTPTPTATPVSFPVSCDGTTTAVCVQPVHQSVIVGGPGEPVSAAVVVTDVNNLGGFQFRLNFDPVVISFSSIDIGDFLGSTGRQVECVPPDVTSSSVTIACTTLGAAPPPGPDGSGVLAVVNFSAVANGTTALGLTNVKVVTVEAVVIPAATQDGSLDLMLATPTPCPGECPTPTITPTPTATLTPVPTPTVDPETCPTLDDATMCVQPGSQTVTTGEEFTVDIVVNNVSELGAYEFEIHFDPIRVGFISVENSTFLGSTGRTVSCVAPLIGPGSVRFACATLGPSPAGPSGSGVLATLTFSAANVGSSDLPLILANLANISGGEILVTGFGAEVHIE